MVITKLYGGLGNQMFQYAAGAALAKRLKTNLYMDLGWFDAIKGNSEVTQRVYELDGFNIKPKGINAKDKISARLRPPKVFKEGALDYNADFEALQGNIILDGYWQSHKYFEDYRDLILDTFKFPAKTSANNKRLLKAINASQSISVHIRRGDYNTKAGRSYHGLISLTYYKKAIGLIQKTVDNPVLFVFSDEIEWCKKNIKFELPTTFIDSNGPNSGVEDMRLMSACKHNIIANSSFSWWAAWLNQNDEKQVYAPKTWFKAVKANLDDRVPSDWLII